MTFGTECHEIRFVGRKTNVMTLMSWELENVMTFIFSGTGAWSRTDIKINQKKYFFFPWLSIILQYFRVSDSAIGNGHTDLLIAHASINFPHR